MNFSNKTILFIITACVGLVSLSCEHDTLDLSDFMSDGTPPNASIIEPADGESVQGIVNLKIWAKDNSGVDTVFFMVNQEIIGFDNVGSNDIYTYGWNTLEPGFIEDEFHFITFTAIDSAGNGYTGFPIRLKVDNTDDEPPTGHIINPITGQIVNGIVDIIVDATDNVGIQYIEYYINNNLIIYQTNAPYVYHWNSTLVQDDLIYSIYVIVVDINNNQTTIPPISVTVNNNLPADVIPPTGAITSPPSGITVNDTVEIQVTAIDDQQMSHVDFHIDGQYIYTDDSAPFSYQWDTTQEEEDVEHTIQVLLVDAGNNTSMLTPISVVVDNLPPDDTIPPTVIITEPAAGQIISGIISIEALVTDNNPIERTEFLIDGELEHADISEPYNYNWDSETAADDQDHTISVIGYDISGNAGPATPITVYVDNYDNIPPTGQILNPFAGQTVFDTVNVEVSATDNVGVDTVKFSIDGLLVFEDNLFPFLYEWDTTVETEDEDHVISVVISDAAYNITYVPPISVFVNNEPADDTTPPIVVISNPLSGQTVSDTVDFTVLAQDNVGIELVEFFIDGSSVGTDDAEPYIYEWDTTDSEVGGHGPEYTLMARAVDLAGNETLAQPILVTVSN